MTDLHQMRDCRECGKTKREADFYGKSKLCKECAKDYQHARYWCSGSNALREGFGTRVSPKVLGLDASLLKSSNR